jgi:6-phosphofructokinase
MAETTGDMHNEIKEIKKIGITTGGGDCPGLNAVIRAVVLHASALGIEVLGIEDGLDGLLPASRRCARTLTTREVRPILARGGTILGTTNRGNPFSYPAPGGRPGRSLR